MGILQVICDCVSCLIAAYLPVSQPVREGDWLVQPLSGCTMSQLHRFMFRRAAAHRKLPAAEDHRQGKLCQGQTGTTHTDWSRGRFNKNADTWKRVTPQIRSVAEPQQSRTRPLSSTTAGVCRLVHEFTSPPPSVPQQLKWLHLTFEKAAFLCVYEYEHTPLCCCLSTSC